MDEKKDDSIRKARERVERMINRYLAQGRYCLNPDAVTVEHVLAGLTQNLIVHGRWYCPCREVTGDTGKDRANLCPCPQHHTDIARDGVCECGIFVSHEYLKQYTSTSCGRPRKET